MPLVPILVETEVAKNDIVEYRPLFATELANKQGMVLSVTDHSHKPPFFSPHHMHVWLEVCIPDADDVSKTVIITQPSIRFVLIEKATNEE